MNLARQTYMRFMTRLSWSASRSKLSWIYMTRTYTGNLHCLHDIQVIVFPFYRSLQFSSFPRPLFIHVYTKVSLSPPLPERATNRVAFLPRNEASGLGYRFLLSLELLDHECPYTHAIGGARKVPDLTLGCLLSH